MWFRTALFDRNPLQENVYQQNIQTLPLKYFGCILPETSLHAILVKFVLDEHQHSNPKKFWKYIKSKKQDCVSIPPLKVNNVTITESKAKADALNSYFGSVFTSTHVSESESPQSTPFPSINDVHVTTQGIVNLINKMKPNKASDPDKIPARLLKLIPREAATILSCLPTVFKLWHCSIRLVTRLCHTNSQERRKV